MNRGLLDACSVDASHAHSRLMLSGSWAWGSGFVVGALLASRRLTNGYHKLTEGIIHCHDHDLDLTAACLSPLGNFMAITCTTLLATLSQMQNSLKVPTLYLTPRRITSTIRDGRYHEARKQQEWTFFFFKCKPLQDNSLL